MKKLRWAMDGGFWDLDMSTPVTIDGLARPVPGYPLPLGLSRGTKLSRPKQIDFMHRFMSMPLVPAFAGDPLRGGDGFNLQRVITFPFGENWFATVLGQFNLQKLVSSMKESGSRHPSESSWLKNIGKHLCNKSLYALGFCSEFLLSPDDTLFVSSEAYGDKKTPRNKAVFHHKASGCNLFNYIICLIFHLQSFFPHHNLTVEAIWPGFFVDKLGAYWDVPLLMAIDLASVASDSGLSYHLCVHHNSGSAKQLDGDQIRGIPSALLHGVCARSAFAFKKNVDVWRSKAGKLKMVQPFDMFLSDPHVSASGIIGTVASASLGDNSVKSQGEDDESQGSEGFCLRAPGAKTTLLADLFASLSCTAQHGNFQRLFLDLTRFNARLDFPSGSRFLSGAARLAQDRYNSQPPNVEAIQAICPHVTLSLQQQILGPLSFRVDSKVALDLKDRDWRIHVYEPVFALEYAMQVLGSAKAIAWYSPKHREAMVELRFFET
ncbi:hypothetical protein HHK36_026278 [Tetracentron sinense]|uniref:Protein TRIGALACTOSYLDIACYLGLYCEROL 4, chloroplastic n=1 Tax=Tetracentron sinense TaxID=13715 RepID=A0A834YGI2_TETSI|nr:hypothetical protein HHK36_026278 [Tetracentron sinense]